MLSKAGITGNYSSHSFRIGTATSASATGLLDSSSPGNSWFTFALPMEPFVMHLLGWPHLFDFAFSLVVSGLAGLPLCYCFVH